MIAEFKYHKDMTLVIICDLCMSSLLFIYFCFNVFKTSNNSRFFRIRYCHKYIVRAKQQFQKMFIKQTHKLYISSVNIQASKHFYATASN